MVMTPQRITTLVKDFGRKTKATAAKPSMTPVKRIQSYRAQDARLKKIGLELNKKGQMVSIPAPQPIAVAGLDDVPSVSTASGGQMNLGASTMGSGAGFSLDSLFGGIADFAGNPVAGITNFITGKKSGKGKSRRHGVQYWQNRYYEQYWKHKYYQAKYSGTFRK